MLYRALLLEIIILLSLPALGQMASIDDLYFEGNEPTYAIGALSAKWESGNKGPGTISNSNADPGGQSYGTYQISTKHGYISDFLQNEGAPFCDYFDESKPGTEAFNEQWKSIAKEQKKDFHRSQHQYIKRTHYDPFVQRLEKQLSINIDDFTPVLKDVLWSISVQHGPYTKVVKNALTGKKPESLTESELIKLIYQERAKQIGGQLIYFPRVLDSWQQHLTERFELELKDALHRLDYFMTSNTEKNIANTSSIEHIMLTGTSTKPANTVILLSNRPRISINSLSTTKGLLLSIPIQALEKQPSYITTTTKPVTDTSTELQPKTYRIILLILDNPNHSFSELPEGSVYSVWDKTLNIYKYYTGKNLNMEEAQGLKEHIYQKGYRIGKITEH